MKPLPSDSQPARRGPWRSPSVAARSLLQWLVPERHLIRSSAIIFFGGVIARLLGFLFSVAAARLLLPANYGLLAYALAIVNISSVLITNAPAGLARFVARYQGDQREQNNHFSNWLIVVAAMLAISLLLAMPFALIAGLSGWLLAGVIANLVGLAVLYTYTEAQRGLEHYTELVLLPISGNFVQLAAILLLAAFGWRSPAVFLMIYGLSFMAPLLFMQPVAPIALSFVQEGISWHRINAIARFIRPAILQTIFFSVWYWADLILVKRLLSPEAAGNYAAAKTLALAVFLAPNAISSALVPRVARLLEQTLRKDLLRIIGLAVAVTVPVYAGLTILRNPITALVFGSKYPHVAEPVAMLALGMGFYGLYLILEATWLGLGRLKIDAVATGAGMVCTLVLGLVLVPRAGLAGAAFAFAVGAATQLAVIGAFTVWGLYLGSSARVGHLQEPEFDRHVSRTP